MDAAGVGTAGAAQAQGRNSSFYPNSSMTFRTYIEPFPTFDNAEACRDACARASKRSPSADR